MTATTGSAATGLERKSVDGITLTAEQIMFDYGAGDGPELTLSIRGEHPEGTAGVQMNYDLVATTDTIDSIGWAASAETYVALVEVGPSVVEVRLISAEGRIDTTVPTERLALLGIRTADPDGATIQAFDASGAVVGTCAQDDFFICTTPA